MSSGDQDDSQSGQSPVGETVSERELDERYRALEKGLGERTSGKHAEPSRMDTVTQSQGFRMATEFVAAILVGAFIGWGIDKLAGTLPWGMIILTLTGFVAGVLSVVRQANAVSKRQDAPDSS